jgi:hypothetical protein
MNNKLKLRGLNWWWWIAYKVKKSNAKGSQERMGKICQ